MLSRLPARRYTMRSYSIALLALCAGCGFGFLAVLGSIDPVRVASQPVPHMALYSMSADGCGLKRLADDPQFSLWGPAWSPDGKHIAVSFVPTGVQGPKATPQLYLLDADGQNARQLTDIAIPGSLGPPGARRRFPPCLRAYTRGIARSVSAHR
jgi:hypothetical protein